MNHPKQERTLVIIKPDGVQRTLIGEIIGRFEKIGFEIGGYENVKGDGRTYIEKHYTLDPKGRRITGEKRIKNAKRKRRNIGKLRTLFEITATALENSKNI